MPPDALAVWVATAIAAAAFLGVAVAFPAAPPPDAAGVAATVDGVAAADYPAATTHRVDADAARVGRHRIALRNDAGRATAEFGYGPVVPVPEDGGLRSVLYGTPPGAVFDDGETFHRAVKRARNLTPAWRSTDRVRVRRVSWRGVDATLVGA